MKPLLRGLLLLALAMATSAQVGENAYFSLTSANTFAPGERATVQMSAFGVDDLDFRVYHVQDPVKFFSLLEDPHQFGGRAPEPPREQTLLERFHSWKRAWHSRIRNTFRYQYNQQSRAAIHERLVAGITGNRSNATNLAEAPVLNSQQLVAKWKQKVSGGNRWEMQTVPLGIDKRGVYLVEAVHGDLRAYAVAIVTDLAMIVKSAPGQAAAFVVNRTTGRPIPTAQVTLWEAKQPPQSLTTDGQGLVQVKLPGRHDSDFRLMARRGDDFAANTLSAWSIGSDFQRNWSGYIYTDRPVYRPGHTVQFKALLRQREALGYSIPVAKAVDVEIQGPDQKSVYHQSLPLSKMGALHDSWVAPASAALGYYTIQIHSNQSFLSGGFEVQEYKKPEYEVRATPGTPRVIQGEKVQVTIDARYYFGEPVKGAKVTYAVHRSRYWSPVLYAYRDEDSDEFAQSSENEPDDQFAGEQQNEETGTLDADGKLTVSIPTAVMKDKSDSQYRIDARVTDEGNREITGTGFFLATYGSFGVGVEPDQYVYAPGAIGTFTLKARTYDNQPVQTTVRAQIEELHWGKKEEQIIVKASASAQTDPQGNAKVTMKIPEGGSYRVRVMARTPEGRDVESETYLWVSGGYADLYGDNRQTLQLVTDKKTYSPGDTAKVLILTGVPKAQVLVSVESTGLESARVVAASGSSVEVEVPVQSGHAPGFYVSASFIYQGKLYQGSKRVKVPPVAETLQVALSPSKPQFQPGEKATYSLDVKDSGGKPVPAADFSLGVVDEAIYAIRKDTTPDIVKFFYGDFYNAVSTESSLTYYFHGEAGKRRMMLAQMRPRALAQIKAERLVQPKIRKVFPDTAFWNADVETDARGHAQVQFEFPDSLTTWRATARGITADTKVGTALVKTIVRKNLILRLVVPRFFTAGDEVTISAIVHNYLTSDKQAQVSLSVKGLDIIDGGTREVPVPSRGDAKIDWRVKAGVDFEAVITGKALTNEESDAMELTLPVHPKGVRLSDAHGGSLTSGAATATLNIPAQSEPSSRSIDIELSPSIAGSIYGALGYLTSFPYGCTEQTMSSFLPNVVVAQAMKELKIQTNVDPADLAQKVNAGLERLYSFQHEDGGWGWWKTDESVPFMTAYVVSGLAQAKAAGYPVRDDLVENAVNWLKAEAKREPRLAPDLKAWDLYAIALSGKIESPLIEDAYGKRKEMSTYGLALLGLALDTLKDSRAKDVGQQVAAKVQQDGQEAHWSQDHDWLMEFNWDVSAEATAYSLKLLARTDPHNPLLPKAALWLMNNRNEGYYWSSTKQTAMVVFGLTDYLKATNELQPSFTATVFVNGKQSASRSFMSATSAFANNLPMHLTAAATVTGANPVRVEIKGTGRLYWSARAEYYSTEQRLTRTGTAKLNILRDYYKLSPNKTGEKVIWDMNPVNGPLAVGDIVAVRLTLTGDDWRYLLVEDPIPAGCEFIERDDLYELKSKPDWWTYWFTRRELHDNRMALFQTYFNAGQHFYFYLLKVVNPGKFQVNPARVEPMYQPKYISTTESLNVEVK